MPHYYIWTIGCQMNRAESERLESLFQHLGYRPAQAAAEADLILLNGCVVRQHAEDRIVNKIISLKKLKNMPNPPLLAVASTFDVTRVSDWARARSLTSTARSAPMA